MRAFRRDVLGQLPVSAPIFFFFPTRSLLTSLTISSATGRATSLSMRAISRCPHGLVQILLLQDYFLLKDQALGLFQEGESALGLVVGLGLFGIREALQRKHWIE